MCISMLDTCISLKWQQPDIPAEQTTKENENHSQLLIEWSYGFNKDQCFFNSYSDEYVAIFSHLIISFLKYFLPAY